MNIYKTLNIRPLPRRTTYTTIVSVLFDWITTFYGYSQGFTDLQPTLQHLHGLYGMYGVAAWLPIELTVELGLDYGLYLFLVGNKKLEPYWWTVNIWAILPALAGIANIVLFLFHFQFLGFLP